MISGNSFNLDSLRDIDKFVDEWNCPKKSFINPELESIRKELWNKCHEFIADSKEIRSDTSMRLSKASFQIESEVIWIGPNGLITDVKAVNEMASEVFIASRFYQIDARGPKVLTNASN